MDRRWILGGLLLAGVVVVKVASASRKPRLADDDRILLIGDSLAIGLAPHLAGMADEEGVPFLSSAVSGTTIRQWADREDLADILASADPTLVLVSLGTNDQYSTPRDDFLEREREAVARLLERLGDVKVLWIGPPDLPRDLGVPEVIQEAVGDQSYFDSRDCDFARTADGVHATALGYAQWAGAIWRWLL